MFWWIGLVGVFCGGGGLVGVTMVGIEVDDVKSVRPHGRRRHGEEALYFYFRLASNFDFVCDFNPKWEIFSKQHLYGKYVFEKHHSNQKLLVF